jgi:hypothetical protein
MELSAKLLRGTSDEELSSAIGRAFEVDHPNTDRLVAELDRRDMAPLKEEQRLAVRREAAARRAEAKKQATWDEVARRIEAGTDPREAVAEVTGLSVDKQLNQELFARLKAEGVPVRPVLEDMIRYKFREETTRAFLEAENATRGHMLNQAGEANNTRWAATPAKQIDPRALFVGPESRARKWASDELKQYWDLNGRPTLDQYREQLITGTVKSGGRRVDDFLV